MSEAIFYENDIKIVKSKKVIHRGKKLLVLYISIFSIFRGGLKTIAAQEIPSPKYYKKVVNYYKKVVDTTTKKWWILLQKKCSI